MANAKKSNDTGAYPQESVTTPSSPVSKKTFKDTLKDIGKSALGDVAGGIISYGFDALNRWHEERQQRKIMREQFRLNEESQRRMMTNMAESYKRAGLSTGLLSEGSFSPAQVSVPSVPEKSTKTRGVSLTEAPAALQLQSALESQAADRSVMEAQKRNIDAETEHQQIVNARERDKDETLDMDIRIEMQDQIDGLRDVGEDKLADALQARLDDGRIFTTGSAEALGYMQDMATARNDYERQFTANKLANLVTETIFNSPDVVAAMAVLPYEQVQSLRAEQNRARAQIAQLYASIPLMKSEAALNAENVEKLKADINKIFQDMDISKKTNMRYALRTGDFGSVLTNGTIDVWEGALEIATLGAYAKGAKTVFGAGKSSLSELPTRSGTGFGRGLSPIELARVPISERRKAAQIEFNSWKNSHRQASKKELQAQRDDIGYKYGLDMNSINAKMRGRKSVRRK